MLRLNTSGFAFLQLQKKEANTQGRGLHRGCEERSVTEDIEDILTGRNQERFALANTDAIDVGLAIEANDDNEGIDMKINLLRYLNYDTIDVEVGTVDELRGGTGRIVTGTIFGPYLIVDGILGLVDVELARIAVGILTAEVIDAIGDVGGLLDFGEEVTSSDGMQTPSG